MNKEKILKIVKVIQPDISGLRWNAEDCTLFLVLKGEDMETNEFSLNSLTRHVMEGIEKFLFHEMEPTQEWNS